VAERHPALTTTSYALLGLLALRSWTTYELTKQVQRSLGWFWPRTERKLYDEPPAPPVLELESMVKVFFADSGSIEQLRATLDHVRASAEARLAELERMVDEDEDPGYEFAGRLPINALGLRFHLDHERHLLEWATWAQAQIEGWRSPVDAAGWDWRAALAP